MKKVKSHSGKKLPGKKRLDEFYVPSGFIVDFAKLLEKYKLNNVIAGVEDNDVVVFIDYRNSQQKIINRIHNKIGEYVLVKSRKGLEGMQSGYTGSHAFDVPVSFMLWFTGLISKHNLKNAIIGPSQTKQGWVITVVVVYEPDQQQIIDEILETIEKYLLDQKDDRWKLNGVKRKAR
jgi:hypothetical protein